MCGPEGPTGCPGLRSTRGGIKAKRRFPRSLQGRPASPHAALPGLEVMVGVSKLGAQGASGGCPWQYRLLRRTFWERGWSGEREGCGNLWTSFIPKWPFQRPGCLLSGPHTGQLTLLLPGTLGPWSSCGSEAGDANGPPSLSLLSLARPCLGQSPL